MIKDKIEKIKQLVFPKEEKEQENNYEFYGGTFSEKDALSPGYFNLENPKYMEIDQRFYSTLLIVNYYREQTDLILKTLIDSNLDLNISVFYEKQNPYKIIKDLTYHIGTVSVELKDGNQNKSDIDIAAFTYNDAKYIRREIQVNRRRLLLLVYLYHDLCKGRKRIGVFTKSPRRIVRIKRLANTKSIFPPRTIFFSWTSTHDKQ